MDKYFVLDFKNGYVFGDDMPYDTLEKAIREFEYQLAHLTMKEKIGRNIMVVFGECDDGCLSGSYGVCREWTYYDGSRCNVYMEE